MPKSKDQTRKEANERKIDHANEYWLKLANQEISSFHAACSAEDLSAAKYSLMRAVGYLYHYYSLLIEAGKQKPETLASCAGILSGRKTSAIFGSPYRMLEDLFEAWRTGGRQAVVDLLAREGASFIDAFHK